MSQSDQKPITYAFIDSQNLYKGVQSQGFELNYSKFRQFLKDKYNVKRAYLFIGYIEGKSRRYQKLQEAGFVCVFKPTLEIKDKVTGKIFVKGNVDAELVLHTMIQIQNFDKAIIITSDGDFHCLIEYLVTENKLEKLIITHKKYSSLLRGFSEYILPIELIKDKIKKGHSRKL